MEDYQFLSVNHFLRTEMDVRALKSAVDLGLVDQLEVGDAFSLRDFASARKLNFRGIDLLADMLSANGVLLREGETVKITPAFQTALRYRDLLETRIEFADLVWPDIHSLFTPLLVDLPQFMARSKVFELFRYDRCLEVTRDNLQATARWTKFTTCLTRYEAAAALEKIDLGPVERFIDFGGNTGEFAFQLAKRRPGVEALVVDLPVVCALGKAHLDAQPEPSARNVTFFPCDMRQGTLPEPADLVSFKSVLHDWPDQDAVHLLQRAWTVVRPGGRLLIFERAPIEVGSKPIPYSMAPDLVFLHFLRSADLYVQKLTQLGCSTVEYARIKLDTAFHLIVANRPA